LPLSLIVVRSVILEEARSRSCLYPGNPLRMSREAGPSTERGWF
jgi:hypothetical protein